MLEEPCSGEDLVALDRFGRGKLQGGSRPAYFQGCRFRFADTGGFAASLRYSEQTSRIQDMLPSTKRGLSILGALPSLIHLQMPTCESLGAAPQILSICSRVAWRIDRSVESIARTAAFLQFT